MAKEIKVETPQKKNAEDKRTVYISAGSYVTSSSLSDQYAVTTKK